VTKKRDAVGTIEPKLQQREIKGAKYKPADHFYAQDFYLRAVANYYPGR
jgi:hypothetical protein